MSKHLAEQIKFKFKTERFNPMHIMNVDWIIKNINNNVEDVNSAIKILLEEETITIEQLAANQMKKQLRLSSNGIAELYPEVHSMVVRIATQEAYNEMIGLIEDMAVRELNIGGVTSFNGEGQAKYEELIQEKIKAMYSFFTLSLELIERKKV